MPQETILPGQTFGRWMVLDDFQKTPRGEKKWLCRCECGTVRYVLERSLKHGGSLSCGCLRKEAARKASSYELTGQVFGDLTVLGRSSRKTASNGLWWLCKCSCGNTCEVLGTLLVTGRKSHCGCKTVKNYAYSDITGKHFGRLVAQYPLPNVGGARGKVWHCLCECGDEVDVPYNDLMYANRRSCGCQKKEHEQSLSTYLIHVDGTSLDMLASKKVPTNNTTGVRGVYLIKGKYVAKLVFQKKAYYLGTYSTLEEAAEARKAAEEEIFQSTVDYYTAWQIKAADNPEWAKDNPVQIFVTRRDGHLQAEFLPILREGDTLCV